MSNITCSRKAHGAPLNRHMSCGTNRAQYITRSIMSSHLSIQGGGACSAAQLIHYIELSSRRRIASHLDRIEARQQASQRIPSPSVASQVCRITAHGIACRVSFVAEDRMQPIHKNSPHRSKEQVPQRISSCSQSIASYRCRICRLSSLSPTRYMLSHLMSRRSACHHRMSSPKTAHPSYLSSSCPQGQGSKQLIASHFDDIGSGQ